MKREKQMKLSAWLQKTRPELLASLKDAKISKWMFSVCLFYKVNMGKVSNSNHCFQLCRSEKFADNGI